jgi:serine/threonine protein kinase
MMEANILQTSLLSKTTIEKTAKRFNGKIKICDVTDFAVDFHSIGGVNEFAEDLAPGVHKATYDGGDVAVKIFRFAVDNEEERLDVLSEISILKSFQSNKGIINLIGAGFSGENSGETIKV